MTEQRSLEEIEHEFYAWTPKTEEDLEQILPQCGAMAFSLWGLMASMHPLQQKIAISFVAAHWVNTMTQANEHDVEHFIAEFERNLRDHLKDLQI